jgi:SAM-dependent methyltransferase
MLRYKHPITFRPTGDELVDFGPAMDDFDENVRRLLPAARDAAILDLGCGWGQFLWWLKLREYTGGRGIDVGHQQVDYCRSLGLDAIRVDSSLQYLHHHPSTFDRITLNHVIEHMPASVGLDLLQACREALKEGGSVIVQTPNMSAVSAAFSRYIEISHVTGFTQNSLLQILQLAGFSEVRVFGNRTPFKRTLRRMVWLAVRASARFAWRLMLIAELGSDAPSVLTKNLYAVGQKASGSPHLAP